MAIVPFAHRRDVPGDQHLRRPAVGVVAGRVSPVAVPVLVELALVGDHGVVYAVGRTDGEVVAGAAVAIQVDHQVYPVDLLLEVALQPLGNGQTPGWGRG